MNAYQVKFKVIDCKGVYGGICFNGDGEFDNYVICGCCGYVFPLSQVEIIERYKEWVNLSEEIKGDE